MLAVFFCVLLWLSVAPAAVAAADQPHLTIPRVVHPPRLDDWLAAEQPEAATGMRRVEGFIQRFPNDGEPETERTVVYVGYDRQNFYAIFRCFDREPSKIGAHFVSRDLFPSDEDSVALMIDTFRDQKHAYGFQVNAFGMQTDGTYTEGTGWDLSWDSVWHSEGRPTSDGFVVLIAVPFKSLRFPSDSVQRWGMFFYRAIPRKGEVLYWPACSTRIAARFPQAAIVDGVADVSPGRNLAFAPYAAARTFRVPASRGHDTDGAIGIDAKVVVRDSLVIDATVNPDFSQVESDQPQITVNRPFEVFFPEKRPFFLENAASFTTPIQLLFTRRIADPLLGGRITGRIGPYSVGAMVVDDRATEQQQDGSGAAWVGVARVMRDVAGQSYIGAFVSSRSAGKNQNRVAAADTRVRLGANWFVTAQSAMSTTTGVGTASAWLASLVGSGRRFNYSLELNDRGESFRAVDGFVPRVDLRTVDQTYSYRARPSHGALQAIGPDLVVNRTWDHQGRPLDWFATPRFEFQWPRLTTLDLYYTAAEQALRPSEVPTIPETLRTRASRWGAVFTTAVSPRVIGSATVFRGDATNLTPRASLPQAGRVFDATGTASLRLSRALTSDWSLLFDRLSDRASERVIYSNVIARLRLGNQFTRATSLRAIVQYTRLDVDRTLTRLSQARNVNYDVLFTYLASPGTALYIGANYDLLDIGSAIEAPASALRSDSNRGWQVFTKVSYLLRR